MTSEATGSQGGLIDSRLRRSPGGTSPAEGLSHPVKRRGTVCRRVGARVFFRRPLPEGHENLGSGPCPGRSWSCFDLLAFGATMGDWDCPPGETPVS
jgi:hypothetical protein